MLGNRNPSDVSKKELQDILKMARDSHDLWGDLSAAERIEKVFAFFGRGS